MKINFRVGLLTFLIATGAQRVAAIPLAFDFSFVDFSNGNNLVKGVVSGLTDNATSSASSVFVMSNTGGYGIGEYMPAGPNGNLWSVTNGSITSVNFISYGFLNVPPAVVCCSLILLGPEAPRTTILGGLSDRPRSIRYGSGNIVTFTAGTQVPIPSMLALLGLGLFALGVSRHGRQSPH